MCSGTTPCGVGSAGVHSRGRRSDSLIFCGRALLWLRSRGQLSSDSSERGGEMEGSTEASSDCLASGGTSPRARGLVAVNEPARGELRRRSDRSPAASCLRCATRCASESVPRCPRPRLGTPGRSTPLGVRHTEPVFAGELSEGPGDPNATGREDRASGETGVDLDVARSDSALSRSLSALRCSLSPLRFPTTRGGGVMRDAARVVARCCVKSVTPLAATALSVRVG